MRQAVVWVGQSGPAAGSAAVTRRLWWLDGQVEAGVSALFGKFECCSTLLQTARTNATPLSASSVLRTCAQRGLLPFPMASAMEDGEWEDKEHV